MTLVFLDLETTGLNPRRHEVMQIAAVAVDEHLRVLEEFEVKVRVTGRNVPRGMLRRTRYDPELWRRTSISPKFAACQLARFLRRHSTRPSMGSRASSRVAQLVAHNAEFDGPFLEAWAQRQKVHMPVSFRAVCTIQRAEWYFIEAGLPRPRSMTLLALCEHFGVDFRPEDAHEALADARATLALYRALTHAARRAGVGSRRRRSARGCRPWQGGEP